MSFFKSIDQLHAELQAVRRDLIPDAYLAPGGPFWCDDYVTAVAAADVHQALATVRRDSIPSTARGDALERWAALIGVLRKGATPARKAQALAIKGQPGALVSAGVQLRARRGGRLIALAQDARISLDGTGLADVVSLDVGPSARFEAGTAFEFVSPPPDITQSAKLVRPMDEGGEALESEGSHQARVARYFARPPQGGNADDYESRALELDDIDAAYVYPRRGGVGTVHMACLHAGSGSARVIGEGTRQLVQAHVDEWRPVGARFLALRAIAEPVDIELAVATLAEPAYAWDWDDSPEPRVESYDPATWELVFNGVVPPTLQPMHRLCVASADPDATAGAEGLFATVAALTGPDRVQLAPERNRPDNPLGFVPSTGDRIHAGSDVAVAVREAVLAELHRLGTANPGGRYGSWTGNIDPNRLQGLAFAAQRGVARAETVTPTAIVEASDPSFPDHESIGLLVPRQVIVRRLV